MIYERATWTAKVGRCQPGALALMAHAHSIGLGDLGCYVDRPIRGATDVPSIHREGRAVDLTKGRLDDGWLTAYVERLVSKFEPLGVQQVIWQRRFWRCDAGDGWHPYRGADPHTSHSHVELTWGAAAHLTQADIAAQFAPVLPPVGLELEEEEMPEYILVGPNPGEPWIAVYPSGTLRHIGGVEAGYLVDQRKVPTMVEQDRPAYVRAVRQSGSEVPVA